MGSAPFLSSGPLGPSAQSAQRKLDELFGDAALAFLDEATEGATRLRGPLRIEVVRPLTPEDLSGGLQPAPPPTLREIKASHHNLAKLIAAGRTHIEAGRITGYSPSYISRLCGDPAFGELVTHYATVEDLAASDVVGTMRAIGMDLLDELRRRVEDDPRVFTVSQLQDGIKLLLIEPLKAEAARAGSGGSVAPIQISFVASPTPQAGAHAGAEDARVIEGEAREIG